ncbi:ATP-binding cassette domain-containing protein [Amycolatopsis sp. CA-230715]|uniref:ATP-binding cassette domain-containing protein n=1 Tax=Amycolatopsis sp. CA-230715 TaxID=2745196 RepID=UPI001C027F86|nr:ATP-binding cassette domain-containing protein [Amycolatopsis sp. CA-230715]QWF83730.1 Daunorubicin/doxorubicin resistance ATP-binding protein DrrA [Amycolatopsis sp. CA-230715]
MSSQPGRPRIEASGLGKTYGEVTALTGVSLVLPPGQVLAVLGHNGAGKTTLVDILATRTRPGTGTATVCGYDVVRAPVEVRRRIGATRQFTALDDGLSGTANLVLVARLLGAGKAAAKQRAGELLDSFGLADAADRAVRTYSGGMRRRLDLAAGLVGAPEVLFLDEPTTGLDPVSRGELWRMVRELAGGGTSIVLTTQYLEEADRLADDVLVLAAGAVAAAGTPSELKARLGKRSVTVTFGDAHACERAFATLDGHGFAPVRDPHAHSVAAAIAEPSDVTALVRALDSAGTEIKGLSMTEPSLDDVYLSLHRQAWSTS